MMMMMMMMMQSRVFSESSKVCCIGWAQTAWSRSRWTHLVVGGWPDPLWHFVLWADSASIRMMRVKLMRQARRRRRRRTRRRRNSPESRASPHSPSDHSGCWPSRTDTACSGSPADNKSGSSKRFVCVCVCVCVCRVWPCRTWNSRTPVEFEVWGTVCRCWSHRWSPHHRRSPPDLLWPALDGKTQTHGLSSSEHSSERNWTLSTGSAYTNNLNWH